MDIFNNISLVIIIEYGKLLGIYKNESCTLNSCMVIDSSDEFLTAIEYEKMVKYVVNNFTECEYFYYIDIFR
jgi:hypothetical protein